MAYPSALARTKDWGTETLTDADLEGQLDLIITYINAMMNSTSGHKHDATTSEGPKILTANINDAAGAQGDIIINADGSSLGRLAVGTSGQFVKSDGTDPGWATFAWSDLPDGAVVQVQNTDDNAFHDITTAMPVDDTIPQKTEGDEVMTCAITPKATTNKLKIEVKVVAGVDSDSRSNVGVALFQDDTANALAGAIQTVTKGSGGSSDVIGTIAFTHYMEAGTTSATTFKVRVGMETGQSDVSVNGTKGARLYGGVMSSSITITEIKAS